MGAWDRSRQAPFLLISAGAALAFPRGPAPQENTHPSLESKYNKADSAGYKPFHVSQITSGGERKREREANGCFVKRRAAAQDTRALRPLAARGER